MEKINYFDIKVALNAMKVGQIDVLYHTYKGMSKATRKRFQRSIGWLGPAIDSALQTQYTILDYEEKRQKRLEEKSKEAIDCQRNDVS